MESASTAVPRSWSKAALARLSVLAIVGLALLALWGLWWKSSLRHNRLVHGQHTQVPAFSFLHLDFLHNYHASRHWLAGGDPYVEPFGDPLDRKLCYPPMVLPAFAWCGWLSPRAAVAVWLAGLTALAGLGGVLAWRCRRELGLYSLPLPFVLAAVLWSMPVLFALERGNFDLLVLLFVAPAVWGLRGRTLLHDTVAGGCLAAAAVLKLYPAFLVLALVPLRRLRALGFCVAAGLLLGLPGWGYLPEFRANLQAFITQAEQGGMAGVVHGKAHTLSTFWKPLWSGTPLARLTAVPGKLGAVLLLAPLVVWVSYRVYRRPDGRLVWPYLVWLAAAATFLPQVSYDYNLVFLPLAALAVWDRRDPVWVHVLFAFCLLWWQPLALPIGPRLLLIFKYLGLVAAAASLARRAVELAQPAALGGADLPPRSLAA